MRNRSRSGTDPNVFASNLVRIIEDGEKDKERETQKNPAAVALGRRGGLKGGVARANSMTPAQRSASAKKAARARWKKRQDDT